MSLSMSPMSMNSALALVALMAMASIAPTLANLFKSRPDFRLFDQLPETDDLRPEELMVYLSKRYVNGKGDQIPQMVYNWLTQTGHKKMPNTILDKYGIKNLIALNEFREKKHCSVEELERRRQICRDFEGEKMDDGDQVWREGSRSRYSAESRLLNQKTLLGQYCSRTLNYFRDLLVACLDRRVRDRLLGEDLGNLNELEKTLNRYSQAKESTSSDTQPGGLIKDSAKRYEPNDLAKFKRSCAKLDKLGEEFHFKQLDDSNWTLMAKNCQHVASS